MRSFRLLLPAFACALAGACVACDNPVWEYAMLNWRQFSHHAYYLHRGSEPLSDRAANRILERAADPERGGANLIFTRLDLRRPEREIPAQVRAAAEACAEAAPLHVVLTPRGDVLFSGRLTPADARALLQSPARRRLARMLTDGSNGALVALAAPRDARGEAVRAEALRAIEMGKEYDWQVGLVEVDPADPQEAWLVRQLRLLRPGLGAAGEPMVFGAFGRGHLEGPHVGQYTDARYLLDLIAFMNGPCTCMMNPLASGLDLLTRWDWQSLTQGWVPVAEGRLAPGGFITF